MKVISNASPLISLVAIKKLDLLQQLFTHIIIPTAVYDEIMAQGKSKPGAAVVDRADWIIRKTVKNKRTVQDLRTNHHLGHGESATIALCMQEKADWVLIDEVRGRKVAAANNLKVIGTLGCFVLAKRRKLIQNVKPVLDELMDSGFRLGSKTYEQVLLQANEVSK